MITCSKSYTDFPAGHRQPNHDGHCRFVHGHNYGFTFTFAAHHRDANGFVVDFGKLKEVKAFLTEWFDHTLCITYSDPHMHLFREMQKLGLADLRVMEDTSAEGMAKFVFEHTGPIVQQLTEGRVWVAQVQVWEDSKNAATWTKE